MNEEKLLLPGDLDDRVLLLRAVMPVDVKLSPEQKQRIRARTLQAFREIFLQETGLGLDLRMPQG